MSVYQEPGYYGSLLSLGGLQGVSQRGRQAEASLVVIDNTKVYQLLSSNLHRIFALICNQSGQTIYISLGDGTVTPIPISDGGLLQIDKDMPWTGFIYCTGSSASTGNVTIQELSTP